MKNSFKRNSSPVKIISNQREADCQFDIDSWVQPDLRNPLRQFLKKDQPLNCKTMEQLNVAPLKHQNQNLQAIRSCKSENFQKLKNIESKGHGHLTSSMFGISQKGGKESQKSQKEEAQQVKKETTKVSQQKSLKKTSSSMKLNLHEFITIKNVNIEEFYQLQEVLGQGTFGKVYKAKCKQTKEDRAIKCIKKKKMSEQQTKQFLAQTSLLKKISHPSIIKVYDLYSYQKNYYVVLEYCRGGQLSDYIDKVKVKSQKFVSSIIKQLLRALTYLHSLNIVHRDIKTDNMVFVSKLNKSNVNDSVPIKIIDFGTAVQMKYKFQRDYPLSGTFTYMAPEVIKGVLTEKSDIWSSAVVMIKLLTGINPFSGRSQRQVISNIKEKVINFNVKPFNLISKEARDLLQKMLQRNMHKRPSAKQLLKHPWFQKCKKEQESEYCLMRIRKTHIVPKNNFIEIVQCFLSIHKVNQEQRQRLAIVFNKADKDGSGHIQKNEFIELLQQSSVETTQQQMNNLINHIDKDKSGKIDFNQFLAAMSNKQKLLMRQSLIYAFNHFDTDKTGFLQYSELKQMLKDSPNEEIQEILTTLDKDKDNRISQEQFIQYLLQK